MVLLKPTIAGALLLVLGVLAITILSQYVTMQVQQTERHDLEPHVQFMVGDMADRPYTLPATANILGTVDVTQALSTNENDSGKFHFIVLDDANYQKWSSSSQANPIFATDQQGLFNYTFTAPASGVYHFVFDNRQSPSKKNVVLMVAYDEVLTSRVPDTRIVPVGYALMILGALLLIYGLIRKPQIIWSGNN